MLSSQNSVHYSMTCLQPMDSANNWGFRDSAVSLDSYDTLFVGGFHKLFWVPQRFSRAFSLTI